MANPPQLFRVDRRLDELVLHIRPWSDDVVDKLGFDPRSSYVEDFWLPTLGPSTTWLLRRLAAGFEYSPDGFHLDLAETARSLGLGDRSGQHSPFVRSINRTVQFGLAQVSGPRSCLYVDGSRHSTAPNCCGSRQPCRRATPLGNQSTWRCRGTNSSGVRASWRSRLSREGRRALPARHVSGPAARPLRARRCLIATGRAPSRPETSGADSAGSWRVTGQIR